MKKKTSEKIWYYMTVTAAAIAEVSVIYFAKWAARKFSLELVHRMTDSDDE